MKACDLVGLRVHDLRHTAASLAVTSGANPKVVQQMLGHASAAMTLDVYAGLFSPDLGDVAMWLDEAARQAAGVSWMCPDGTATTMAMTGRRGARPCSLTRDNNRFQGDLAPLVMSVVPPE